MPEPVEPDLPAKIAAMRPYLLVLARAGRPQGLRAKLEASDLVQQTLLQATVAAGDFRGASEGELAAWLRQILTRNIAAALRHFGSRKRDARRERPLAARVDRSSVALERLLPAADAPPSQIASRREQAVRAAERLAALPDAQRRAIELHHVAGLSLAETAARLGRSTGAVAGLLHRGLKALRQELAVEGGPSGEAARSAEAARSDPAPRPAGA